MVFALSESTSKSLVALEDSVCNTESKKNMTKTSGAFLSHSAACLAMSLVLNLVTD